METPQVTISRRAAITYLLAAAASVILPRWPIFGSWAGKSPAQATEIQLPFDASRSILEARSNFHAVYDSPHAREQFFLFLQHIFHLYPEQQLHKLISDLTLSHATDREIYQALLANLGSITPIFSALTYGLPALNKQKTEMAQETAELLGGTTRLHGYLEIGTPGRYIHGLTKVLSITGPVFVLNDMPQGYRPNDIAERGQLMRLGTYVPMGNYESFSHRLPKACVDLVTVFIGFHHAPPQARQEFLASIWHVLRPGGALIVRDHDVNSLDMRTFVALAHDVFNAGTKITWEDNAAQIRNFTSVDELSVVLAATGFTVSPYRRLQADDPTRNTLMLFTKPT